MANKAQLLEKLEAHGIEADPNKTKAQLEEMLAFVNDTDDDDVTVPLETSTSDDDDTLEAEGAAVVLAPQLEQLAPDTSEMTAGDAAELSALFEEYTDDDDLTDWGAGDLDGEYHEVADTYHIDTLVQARGAAEASRPTAEKVQTAEELTPEEVAKVCRPTLKRAVTEAQEMGRKVTGMPIVAHRWPAKGNGRHEVVVQVPLAPQRRTASARRDRRRTGRS